MFTSCIINENEKKKLGLSKFSQNIYLNKNKSGFNLSKISLYSTQKLIFTETITNLETNSLLNCSSFSDLSSSINKKTAERTYDSNKNQNYHNTPTKGNYESILINKNTKTTSYTSNVLSLINNTTNLIRSERSIQEARSRDIISNGIKRTINGDGAVENNKDNVIQYNNSSEITNQKHSVEIMRLNISYISDDISNSSNLDRNERSTFLDITGPARRIQLYIKNRFIQLMPDGTVNGTQDDMSDYTILQRTTVDVGRIKIQGIATCLYLCMDYCGQVYGSKKFTDDCVFNESMEQHNYNTYSSTFNSNSRRIFYLALNRRGEPRKLMIPPTRPLGKLATYTKSITETVQHERVEHLIAKTFGENRVKHGIRQLCDTGTPLIDLTDKILKTRPTCNASNTINNSSHSNLSVSNDNHSNQKSNIRFNVDLNNTNSNSNNNDNSNNSSINNISKNNSNDRVTSIKKKKKKRRCRLNEAESELCNRRAHPLKKHPLKGPCKNHSTEGDCSKRRTGKKKVNKHIPNNKNNGNGTSWANGNRRGKKQNGINVANNEKNVRSDTNDPLKSTITIKRSTTNSPTTQSPLLQITTLHFQQFSSSTELVDTVEISKEETTEEDDEDTEDKGSSLRITNKHIQLVSHDSDYMYNVDLDV